MLTSGKFFQEILNQSRNRFLLEIWSLNHHFTLSFMLPDCVFPYVSQSFGFYASMKTESTKVAPSFFIFFFFFAAKLSKDRV